MNRITEWTYISIKRNEVIRTAMNAMTTLGVQTLLVTENDILLGTLSDGDIRRAILSGVSLEDQVDGLFNMNCRVVQMGEDEGRITTVMNTLGLHVLPEINACREVIAVHTRIPLTVQDLGDVSVLIMAGGKGERLKPLTENIPKPLIKIQDTTLIEILINKLAQAGLRRIFISVHYLADELIKTLGNGEEFGVSIGYVRENVPLGTAGSISLLPQDTLEKDLLVCNSDLLHDLDFGVLLTKHRQDRSDFTVVGRLHEWVYPYGTLQVSGEDLLGLTEKPRREDLIAAGIYVLGPRSRKLIEREERNLAMSDVILRAISSELNCKVFKIDGYWRDVGNVESLHRAHEELWGW